MLKGERCFTPKCEVEKRPKAPGQTAGGRRRRVSDRGMQLREKQKARYTYGVLERQFRRIFRDAQHQTGITQENLIVLLERRLDNVVFRLGFATTRSQARQIVRHGHIMINGHKNDIPSAIVKEGDTITFRPGSQNTEYYKSLQQAIESRPVARWLNLDKATMTAKVASLPTKNDVEPTFEGQSIVEYYSR